MNKNKRVLLVSQYFYPENFKGNDIAFDLVKRGYYVDALVGIPNYPQGEYYKGYGVFKKRKEIINGVNVYRAFIFPRGKKSAVKMMLNYFSYVISGDIWMLFFFLFKKRYDVIFVQGLSPIIQAWPGILLSRLKKIPLLLWVLDIWPDSMISGGGIKNKNIINMVNGWVSRIYSRCTKILISSKKMSESILSKGDFCDKIIHFPNWAEEIFEYPQYYEVPTMPSGFKIVFAGNIGGAQNLDCVMKAALLLKDTDVRWIMIGDGSQREELQKFVVENNLEKSVFFMGRYSIDLMPSFYKEADAMLLSLKNKFPHLQMIVPAKLQSYMAMGKPVIGMINGGAADVIKESDCGVVANAGDYEELAKIIRERVLNNVGEFKRKGENGYEYYITNFKKDICFDNLEKIISDVTD